MPSGTKRRDKWMLRYVSPVAGKRRDIGLAVYPAVNAANARDKAETCPGNRPPSSTRWKPEEPGRPPPSYQPSRPPPIPSMQNCGRAGKTSSTGSSGSTP
ncbi:Arm DNA-binding domain-containing protein [Silvimonas iriomotensis]|uniref:Arm DNA-binding domain-containing protein n=1 Tax=Silvimonas iriomotensis TaxID=449662 RepID=UPI003570F85D